jgi:hypothetical protein
VQNPGWQLRRPRDFITILFDKLVEFTAPTNGNVDQDLLGQLAEAGCGLFNTQKNLTKMSKFYKNFRAFLVTIFLYGQNDKKSPVLIDTIDSR